MALAIDPDIRSPARDWPAVTISLRGVIDTQGRFRAVRVGGTDDPLLAHALRQAAASFSFKPARRHGSGCSALEGLNRNAAIFGTSKACIATHTSDMAVALAALGARVEVLTSSGEARSVSILDLYRLPDETPQVETELGSGDLITAVVLPPPPSGGQIYRKVRDRASYA
eukprot:gene51974-70835_t